jgi:hypothetical protein
MNPTFVDIALQRGRLIERIATQRSFLGHQMQPVQQALDKVDRTRALVLMGGAFVRTHPGTVAAIVAVLALLKPRRAWRWGRRGFIAWRTWLSLRKYFVRLPSLELRRRRW